jgi:HSP20 family protein
MSQIDVTKNPSAPWMGRGGLSSFAWPFGADLPNLSPASIMRRFVNDMDRIFGPAMGRPRGEVDFWMPSLEIIEQKGLLRVSADLPGVRKGDLKVEISNGALILQGERKRAHQEKHDGYYQSERNYGRFHRVIPLPDGANVDKSVAELVNGTLEVSIPIPEMIRHQITVLEGKPQTSFYLDPTVS